MCVQYVRPYILQSGKFPSEASKYFVAEDVDKIVRIDITVRFHFISGRKNNIFLIGTKVIFTVNRNSLFFFCSKLLT